jgi:hypothetical protein
MRPSERSSAATTVVAAGAILPSGLTTTGADGARDRPRRGSVVGVSPTTAVRTMYSPSVPELPRFFGIVIRMFVEAGGQHHRAHFHAYYQEAFSIVGPYTLAVTFTDCTEQRIDFKPVLHGALFGPLQDLAVFNAVTLDSEAGTLVWPNGADFDPATLHDWPQVRDELTARARAWAESATEHSGLTRMEPTRR